MGSGSLTEWWRLFTMRPACATVGRRLTGAGDRRPVFLLTRFFLCPLRWKPSFSKESASFIRKRILLTFSPRPTYSRRISTVLLFNGVPLRTLLLGQMIWSEMASVLRRPLIISFRLHRWANRYTDNHGNQGKDGRMCPLELLPGCTVGFRNRRCHQTRFIDGSAFSAKKNGSFLFSNRRNTWNSVESLD